MQITALFATLALSTLVASQNTTASLLSICGAQHDQCDIAPNANHAFCAAQYFSCIDNGDSCGCQAASEGCLEHPPTGNLFDCAPALAACVVACNSNSTTTTVSSSSPTTTSTLTFANSTMTTASPTSTLATTTISPTSTVAITTISSNGTVTMSNGGSGSSGSSGATSSSSPVVPVGPTTTPPPIVTNGAFKNGVSMAGVLFVAVALMM